MDKNKRLKESWSSPNLTWRQASVLCISEMLGTAILVCMSCMSYLPGWITGVPPPLQQHLGTGLVVMFVVQIFAHISGAHVNPSVTLCSILYGNMSLIVGAIYLVAQCIGATLGYGVMILLTPTKAFMGTEAVFCVTQPHHSVSTAQSIMVEFIATSVLILLNCSVWDSRNKHNTDSTALKFGFTVAVLNLSAASFTGCSMNPARSLGPAIWTNNWNQHWIYWVSPLSASIVSTLFYCMVFRRSDPSQVLQDQEPLNNRQKISTRPVV